MTGRCPSEFQDSGRFHSCHACPDNENFFPHACRLQIIGGFPSAGGIYRTGDRLCSDEPVHTSLMTSKAGTYDFISAAPYFVYQSGVRQKASPMTRVGFFDTCTVSEARSGSSMRPAMRTGASISFSGVHKVDIQALFKIHGRVGPVPGIVGPCIYIQQVISVFTSILADAMPSGISRPSSSKSSPGRPP